MPICEMCGRKSDKLFKILVEGVFLKVCKFCSKYGKIVEEPKKEVNEVTKRIKLTESNVFEEPIETIVPDYPKRIKEAREKMELTQEKLGKAIGEKESVIHKLEAGTMVPTIELARKLEHFLRINLITEYKEEPLKKKIDFKSTTLTIGDLIRMKEEYEKRKKIK